MSGSDFYGADTLHKEVYIRKGHEDWNEINLNPGGIASTLQDVKTQQRAGAYAYKKIPNRFIYWRTEGNVLEMVEESLDVTLHGNQIRYKFTDSQVLDGLTVTETMKRLIILVPTVSSLHVFTYPHPEKLLKKGFGEVSSLSVFHGISESDATDPQTYHQLNCSSSAIVSCTSCIANNGEAIFALGLANASVLLVIVDSVSGLSSSRILSHDNIVPRFLTGILGKDGGEWVPVSLILHYIKKELFLFTLCRGGSLRVWSVDRGSFITSLCVKLTSQTTLKAQKHKMCKGYINGTFILHCCVQGAAIVTLAPDYGNGVFNFTTISEIPIQPGFEVTNMCPGEEGYFWCSWLTLDESPAVTKNNVIHPGFSKVALTRPSLQVPVSDYIPRDPASHYLDAIFSSGFFTSLDIAKAISLYKITAVIKPNIDVAEQICAIVETEIYSEIGEQELDDDEFLDIAFRCWNRLYSCCSQYIISSMLPLGMVWLGDYLVLIQECGFSIVVDIEPLELFMTTAVKSSQFPQVGYGWLVEKLRDINLESGIVKLELSIHTGESIDELSILQEAADLIHPSKQLDDALSIFYEEGLGRSLNCLIEELAVPEDFNKDGTWESFCSYSGVGAVTSAFRDYVAVRLKICEKMLLLTELAMRDDDGAADRTQHRSLAALCKAYYILKWICTSKSTGNAPMIHVFSLVNPTSIMQSSLEQCVLGLANCLWPLATNSTLAQHLLSTKQYALLQTFARLVGINNWSLLLAESYILTGQPGKAFDVCLKNAGSDVVHFLNAIRLFEKHSRSDLVIEMATKALELLIVSHSDRETLESALFVHELGMENYDAAWSWIESCSSWSRRSDFLQRLVANMISEGKLTDLISFSYTGLLDELEKLLASRARSLTFGLATNYYNILYAFHVKHENFKKAASIMLEKALRADTAEVQWKCYGACLSSLMLINDPQQAWLVRPNPFSQEDAVEILEIEDIQREFELSGARYNLDGCSPDASQEEVIALCVTQKLYKTALRLANMCKLSCAPCIQAFTASCAALSEQSISWHWLKANEIDDIIITESNANEMLWRILERCILKYEKENETVLHRASANQLLTVGLFIPTWLLQSYKKRNSSELLRLFVQHGYLEEAEELACEYLNAALGIGREHFSIDFPLHLSSPPLCLPLQTIDILLLELKHYNIGDRLQKKLDTYVNTISRITLERPMIVSTKKK
ncbi:unnamed protein product [Nezara viridula]|uniref:Nuclear pore complex protein Nup160 homolog n=1 Tax=Nezara viridula TaxID=85310 RepID=A0A9P0H5I1_NEZVI|nr:unnamed protein product [Nezara viridula]